MTKQEAREIANKFREDLPHLADRSCRVREHPTSGYNAHTEWYLIPIGPRGGIQKSHYLTFATPGSAVFLAMTTGDILMENNVVNGWKNYNSFVILPFMENHDYLRPERPFEFTLEEQLESAEWFGQFCEPEDLYWLNPLIGEMRDQIQYRDGLRCALCGEGGHD